MRNEIHIGARVSDEQNERLNRACDRKANPYAPTRTQVILRGLELALDELERQKKRSPK